MASTSSWAHSMKLVHEIIDLLGDEKASTQSALLKAQILAHRLGNAELGSWVEHELRGYPDESELPPYRVLKLTLVGHVTNGVYHYSNQTLATAHLKEPLRTNLTTARIRESIATIESWSNKENMALTIPAEALHALSKPLSETYFVQQAWGRYSVGAMDQILIQVRSRLLEFCLKISDKLPDDLTTPQAREKASELGSSEIFRNAVFGDNATIVVGGGTIQGVKNQVSKSDIESLTRFLVSVGVPKVDIDDLPAAISADSDSSEVQSKAIGPSVRSWIGRVVAKAGTAGWDVSIGAAGNLLAAAIASFYGFGA